MVEGEPKKKKRGQRDASAQQGKKDRNEEKIVGSKKGQEVSDTDRLISEQDQNSSLAE